MQPKLATGLIAACITLGLALLVVLAVVVGSQQPPPGAAPAVVAPVAAVSDPYPECAAIRQWLRENTPEPDSLEIIKWRARGILKERDPAAVTVIVTYRATNQYRGKSVETTDFTLHDGKVWSHVPARY